MEGLFEEILGGVIMFGTALIMIGLGISQWKSSEPVGFYTGEKPPARETLRDVKAWNRNHGRMWVLYGLVIILGYVIGSLMGDTIYAAIPMCGGVVLPLPLMIWEHHRLIQNYRKE